MGSSSAPSTSANSTFEVGLLSDVGTNRESNEDSCGHLVESEDSVVVVIADGIGGYEGGEIASAMAVELTLQAYRDNPVAWGPAKRLARAVQFANIEIHNKALTVPELRRMGTTLTAMAIDKGTMVAMHVGDCRLYRIRHGKIEQLSKDHTAVGEKVRMGLLSEAAARNHPERSQLLRSVGHELIVSVDRITSPLVKDDRLVLCSDGLHNVLESREIERLTRELDAVAACRKLIDTANERGTADNLTVAVFTMLADTGLAPIEPGWRQRIAGLFRR